MITAFIDGDFLEHGAAILIFAFYFFLIALVIIVLIRLARYFGSAGKEQQKMRLEMSKLADEVHQLRKRLQDMSEEKNKNSDQSTL